jgi:hypothetical protein
MKQLKQLKQRSLQRGVSLVEFAIVFPFAVLFVLALIQTGFIYMAKLQLNHATFMAARVGSLNNARPDVIQAALQRGLSPFYQDSTQTNDSQRLATAHAKALVDVRLPWGLNIDMLNPSPDAFRDFGVRDPVTRVLYIPNDNLEWRSDQVGARSGLNLRDANLLKLRVLYGYELKVPLMAGILRRIMCGGSSAVEAFGDVPVWQSTYGLSQPARCLYFLNGRIPIESSAIVAMQSRAEQR